MDSVDSVCLSKVVSFVICGRNDNYLGDFKYRLRTSIEFIARSCNRLALTEKVEVVVVDWNSEVPLSKVLELSIQAARLTKFIEVPPDAAREFSPRGEKFKAEFSANIGIRRASGDYIMYIPADEIVGDAALDGIFSILSGRYASCFRPESTVMYCDRRIVPWQIVERKLPIEELDRYLSVCARNLFHDHYHIALCGGYGGILMHRDLWFECEGFSEQNRGWGGSDIDFGLRLNQKYPSVSLAHYGVMLYDMQSRPQEMASRAEAEGILFTNSVDNHNPSWGCGDRLFESANVDSVQRVEGVRSFQAPDPSAAAAKILSMVEVALEKLPGGNAVPKDSAEALMLATLVWYCGDFTPIKYVEFDSGRGLTSYAFSSLCSYGEIYSLDSAFPSMSDSRLDTYVEYLPQTKLFQLGFRGHSQIVTGDVDSIWERFCGLHLGELHFDVVVLRCDSLGVTRSIKFLSNALDAAGDGSTVLLTASSLGLFNEIARLVDEKFSSYFFLRSQTLPFLLLMKR